MIIENFILVLMLIIITLFTFKNSNYTSIHKNVTSYLLSNAMFIISIILYNYKLNFFSYLSYIISLIFLGSLYLYLYNRYAINQYKGYYFYLGGILYSILFLGSYILLKSKIETQLNFIFYYGFSIHIFIQILIYLLYLIEKHTVESKIIKMYYLPVGLFVLQLIFIIFFQIQNTKYYINTSINVNILISNIFIFLDYKYWKKHEIKICSIIKKQDFYCNIYNQIKDIMQKELLYCNSECNLYMISDFLKVKPYIISQALRENNKTFPEFINSLRINHAKELLQNKEYQILTIEEIYKKVGYSSKSLFFTEFKKATQVTPNIFKKNYYESNNI